MEYSDIFGIIDKHLKAPIKYSYSTSNGQYHCYQCPTNLKNFPKRLKIRKTADKEINKKTDEVVEGFDKNLTRIYFAPLVYTGINDLYYSDNKSLHFIDDFILFYFNRTKSVLTLLLFKEFQPSPQTKEEFIRKFFSLVKDDLSS